MVTGSRAEYGILRGLMKAIKDDSELQLQIVATNQHLSKLQGETYKEIERDGFTIDYKVYMADDEAPDNANTTAKAISRGLSGFADAFDELKPDMLLILGDRYEMLAVASTALIYKIPIAHLHGGEITEGAFDDAIRHAITKMSHLHFTSTEAYRKRVIQLGEQPERVFNVGALGVENVLENDFMTKEEICTNKQNAEYQNSYSCHFPWLEIIFLFFFFGLGSNGFCFLFCLRFSFWF